MHVGKLKHAYPTHICTGLFDTSNDFVINIFLGSEASITLENMLLSKRVLSDIRQLSPVNQTSTLEAKHSLDTRFVPKNMPFSYLGMKMRFKFFLINIF